MCSVAWAKLMTFKIKIKIQRVKASRRSAEQGHLFQIETIVAMGRDPLRVRVPLWVAPLQTLHRSWIQVHLKLAKLTYTDSTQVSRSSLTRVSTISTWILTLDKLRTGPSSLTNWQTTRTSNLFKETSRWTYKIQVFQPKICSNSWH